MNARFWGYLHLDLFSGIDMPRLQMDRFFGFRAGDAPVQDLGVRCRHTLPGDASFLVSLLKDGDVGAGSKIRGLARFLLDFADPRLHSDLLFPGDRHLYWRQAAQYAVDTAARIRARLSAPRSRAAVINTLEPAE